MALNQVKHLCRQCGQFSNRAEAFPFSLCGIAISNGQSHRQTLLGEAQDLAQFAGPILGFGGVLRLNAACGQPIFRLRAVNEVQGHGFGCGRGKNR